MNVLKSKIVITRKGHTCHGCLEKYPAKSKMRYVTSVDGGDISSVYYCETCEEVIDKTYDDDDLDLGIDEGEVKERDVDYWQEVRSKYIKNEDVTE
jgi:hypothetical protein